MNFKDFTKPFLKWVGGKSQILENVLTLFPKTINNYHEPFLGGGSVLIGVLELQRRGLIEIKGEVSASDLNLGLIELYKNIKDKPKELVEEAKKLIDEYTTAQENNPSVVNRNAQSLEEALTSPESYYYYTRYRFNRLKDDEKNSVTASAMFLFLNKTCFRGVYREGPNGFNVPFGNYKAPSILNSEHIYKISSLIQNVIFRQQDFTESLKLINRGDFVYLDPPYAPENSKSFVSYNRAGFSKENHEKLFSECILFTDKDIKFVMSNSDVELIHNYFKEPRYKIEKINCRRAINSKNPESKTDEVIITNRLNQL